MATEMEVTSLHVTSVTMILEAGASNLDEMFYWTTHAITAGVKMKVLFLMT